MLHEHIGIVVADSERPGVERVPARPVGVNMWELVRSPLYAGEVASGDVIRIVNNETGEFTIVRRGGNVCVQFYLPEPLSDDADATAELARAIAQQLAPLGGREDARTPGLIVFTIPITAGFLAIEQVFADALARHPGAQWQYSNVYDPITGEPLGWWSQQQAR